MWPGALDDRARGLLLPGWGRREHCPPRTGGRRLWPTAWFSLQQDAKGHRRFCGDQAPGHRCGRLPTSPPRPHGVRLGDMVTNSGPCGGGPHKEGQRASVHTLGTGPGEESRACGGVCRFQGREASSHPGPSQEGAQHGAVESRVREPATLAPQVPVAPAQTGARGRWGNGGGGRSAAPGALLGWASPGAGRRAGLGRRPALLRAALFQGSWAVSTRAPGNATPAPGSRASGPGGGVVGSRGRSSSGSTTYPRRHACPPAG